MARTMQTARKIASPKKEKKSSKHKSKTPVKSSKKKSKSKKKTLKSAAPVKKIAKLGKKKASAFVAPSKKLSTKKKSAAAPTVKVDNSDLKGQQIFVPHKVFPKEKKPALGGWSAICTSVSGQRAYVSFPGYEHQKYFFSPELVRQWMNDVRSKVPKGVSLNKRHAPVEPEDDDDDSDDSDSILAGGNDGSDDSEEESE